MTTTNSPKLNEERQHKLDSLKLRKYTQKRIRYLQATTLLVSLISWLIPIPVIYTLVVDVAGYPIITEEELSFAVSRQATVITLSWLFWFVPIVAFNYRDIPQEKLDEMD